MADQRAGPLSPNARTVRMVPYGPPRIYELDLRTGRLVRVSPQGSVCWPAPSRQDLPRVGDVLPYRIEAQ
jgi:hypothetical protein